MFVVSAFELFAVSCNTRPAACLRPAKEPFRDADKNLHRLLEISDGADLDRIVATDFAGSMRPNQAGRRKLT
jgi:hypothetical protein